MNTLNSPLVRHWPTAVDAEVAHRPFTVFTQRDLDRIEPLSRLTPAQRFEMKVVSTVLPFRVNQYVIDELID